MNLQLRSFILVVLSFISIIQNAHSVAVMSVDLGSEWMKIAIVSPGVPMEIILNTDSQRKTPLAVAFRDGERFIGDSALNIGIRFPEKTFTHFIDLIGKTSLQSVAVKKYLERFPYHQLVETDDKTIAFVLKDNGKELLLTPEELLSMMLNKARHYAEVASASSSPTGQAQTITDCVLTVPPYFSQSERKALKHAAYLAGLKVLQLMNVNSAFALNYGIFRRKDFNTSHPTNILFYDMGAGSTLATIASYQLVKTKDRGYVETDPQLTIKGVAYDRYLGGFELQLRLRDYLLQVFSEQSKKTVAEIKKNKRAMAKLLKEAGRLKKVLSANNEHRAQIENVMNDIDLKAIVTREQFETLSGDLLNERIKKTLDDVFKYSSFTLNEIDLFIIIGGATRIPKVQQQLEAYWSKELSKNVNADEAGALGAAYQAAYLSKGFKVKTFHVKDWNQYQINVDFEREDENLERKTISRTLFGRGNSYPQKKVITFNKNQKNFDFFVNYMEPLPQDCSKDIMKIELSNIDEAFAKHSSDSAESKGIKVHFRMDESGILTLENSEASFEIEYEEELEDKYDQISNLVGDALSKFGSKLSGLFSNNEMTNETITNGTINGTEQNQTSTPTNRTIELEQKNVNDSKPINLTENVNSSTGNTNGTMAQKQLRKKIIKEEITSNVTILGNFNLSDESISVSQEKLNTLNQKEKDKLKQDQMKNALESFIHETKDKLNQDEYKNAASDEERNKIEEELRTVSDWLDYESDGTNAADFEVHLNKLNDLTKVLFDRVKEHRERPEALESLRNMLNISEMFYANSINISKEEQIFTDVELNTLRKLIDETKVWMSDSIKEQEALPKSVNPSLTVRTIVEKMANLDREVKYLLNKVRITPPKKKTKPEDNNTDKKDYEDESLNDGSKNRTKESEPDSPLSAEEMKNSATENNIPETNDNNKDIKPEKVSSGPTKTEL